MTGSGAQHQPPALRLDGPLNRESLERLVPAVVSRALPTFMPTRRWFGEKDQQILNAQLIDSAYADTNPDLFGLCLVRLRITNSEPVDYFVPLAIVSEAAASDTVVAIVESERERRLVIDAPADETFRVWLAKHLMGHGVKRGRRGVFSWESSENLSIVQGPIEPEQSRVVSAEQSNTSILYGQSMIVKLFRRIEPGINPDVELGRFLSSRTTFRSMPLLLADLRYVSDDGNVSSLAVAQEYVTNVGDGWSFVLDALTSSPYDLPAIREKLVADAHLLGRRTAQMHLALASDELDSAFRPEIINDADVKQWNRDIQKSITIVERIVAEEPAHDSNVPNDLIRAFQEATDLLRARLVGLDSLIGRTKFRVHGDYHLGQTLRTTAGDWIILDFEGEPQRSLYERRVKTTPLKDVAGMLRSFGYARGTAERAERSRRGSHSADISAWASAVRRAFLDAYYEEADAGASTFLPDTAEEYYAALLPWELDKAMYEVQYELSNRPDWLWLPLTTTLELI